MSTEIRFVLAIALMIGVLIVTNVMFPPTRPQPPVGESQDTAAATATEPVRSDAAPDAAPSAEAAAPAGVDSIPATPDQPERRIVVEGPLYRHVFSTRGARLVSAELLQFRSFTREGPVQLLADTAIGALGLRLFDTSDRLDPSDRPVLDLRDLPFVPSAEGLVVGPEGEGRLTFRHDGPGLAVEINYLFHPDNYLIEVTGSVRGVERALLVTDLGAGLALNDADQTAEARALAYVGNHLEEGVTSHELAGVQEPVVEDGPLLWAAFKSKFFVLAMLPGAEGMGPEHFGGMLVRPLAPDRVEVGVTENVVGDQAFGYRAFVGPQEYARLTALGSDLDEVNPYGWRLFRPIIRPLVGVITGLLVFMHNTLNLAYGWVLVLFGLLMRVVLWPFNQKAMRAQMKNMAVQPMLKEIQTKYKDNPEKLQKEMLRLYKEYGFNPMAGCLPMLLPWPVLISLFFVFQNTIEFRGASFLWMPDLSAPDPIYILPVFLGASMFLLQWISMRGMPENPQMKMMMWIMPIMMVFIFFNLAAGLNLYYSVSNLATIPQQLMISKERLKAQGQAPLKLKTT